VALAGEFIPYLQRDVFPDGGFFAAVGAEFSGALAVCRSEIDVLPLMAHATYTMFGDRAFLKRPQRRLERIHGRRPDWVRLGATATVPTQVTPKSCWLAERRLCRSKVLAVFPM
jgi:hypothetical protein